MILGTGAGGRIAGNGFIGSGAVEVCRVSAISGWQGKNSVMTRPLADDRRIHTN